MLIQVPRTRLSITPTNVRPLFLDSTPNRQQILNMTTRQEEPHQRSVIENRSIHKPNSLTRIPGSSFYQQGNKDLQQQIQELMKQKESIQFTLQEALKKNNHLQICLDQLKEEKTEQQFQFQMSLEQFSEEINTLSQRLEDLINENTQLQEQYQSQQFYISQFEHNNQQDQFNVTHHFGQM